MDDQGVKKRDFELAFQIIYNEPSTSFVSNPIRIDSEALPFTFSDGSVLDRATSAERENITSTLGQLIGKTGAIPLASIFEFTTIVTELPNGGRSHQPVPLPESDWKYYVVRYPAKRSVNVDLHFAASICEVPLDLLSFHFSETHHAWRSESLQKYFNIGMSPLHAGISADSLKEIASTYDLVVATTGGAGGKGDFPEIRRALHMLDSLNDLPKNSDFLCLGLFAIIEMLITHNPRLEDRGDSITHQMRSKVPLLSRRFDRQLPLSKYFGEASSEKIWSALYSYRSSLAHGGVPNFNNDHRILVSKENADKFLLETVKSLIRHALREPFLYSDLRAC